MTKRDEEILPFYACFFIFTLCMFSQIENGLFQIRTDLRSREVYLKEKVIGFTVIHGSQKAEDVEMALIKAQLVHVDSLAYFPEIDAAMGYYFNEYLKNGDEGLLKDLILTYNFVFRRRRVSLCLINGNS